MNRRGGEEKTMEKARGEGQDERKERREDERRGEKQRDTETNRLLGKDNHVSIWMDKHWPHAQD